VPLHRVPGVRGACSGSSTKEGVQLRLVRSMPEVRLTPRDRQAVGRFKTGGIGDEPRQFVCQQISAASLKRAVHTARLSRGLAGLQTAEAGDLTFVWPALLREQRACRLLVLLQPPCSWPRFGPPQRPTRVAFLPARRGATGFGSWTAKPASVRARCRMRWLPLPRRWRSRLAAEPGSAPAACCG
jgi:hypothetical protein